MLPLKYLWTLLIAFCAIGNQHCQIIYSYSEEYIKTTKIECAPSPKYFYNHSCRLKPINRYKTLAFMDTYIRDALRNVSVNIGVYARNDVNLYKPFLINTTQNLCWFLEKKFWGPYLRIFIDVISKYSNVNHSCPFTGSLFVKNLFIDRKVIPVAFPRGAYKILLIFYEGYPLDYMGTVAYYVDLLEKRTTPLRKIILQKLIKWSQSKRNLSWLDEVLIAEAEFDKGLDTEGCDAKSAVAFSKLIMY
ncbi:uncharacterized protein LOC131997250 [Stomoxys calcitrans]|uniref:uncharacterized protein LOC131997250 n=1 Tax=Stomoxys calcitrans TaxID=35570 RepID=UPI0027E35F42|nr:uncharacterized protein LOC131997250 [Stomoxys calcitrans]